MGVEKRAKYNFDFVDEQVEVTEWPYSADGEGRVDIEGITTTRSPFVMNSDINGHEVLGIQGEFLYICIRTTPGFLAELYEVMQKWKEYQDKEESEE